MAAAGPGKRLDTIQIPTLGKYVFCSVLFDMANTNRNTRIYEVVVTERARAHPASPRLCFRSAVAALRPRVIAARIRVDGVWWRPVKSGAWSACAWAMASRRLCAREVGF